MSLFTHKLDDIGAYSRAYQEALAKAWDTVDEGQLAAAAIILHEAYTTRRPVLVCGNGGSAAISNHLVCDHSKGAAADTQLSPPVISLSANVEMLTAIANDIGFEDVFAYQARRLAEPGSVLITISSSGNSPNIVKVTHWARENKIKVIAMTGFAGGVSRELADVCLHVQADNYGVIEDVHQGLMHVLAQFIRQSYMQDEQIAAAVF